MLPIPEYIRCEIHGEFYAISEECHACRTECRDQSVTILRGPADENPIGEKHDKNKPRFSLLPLAPIKEIINVLEFGAEKYSPDNWQKVDNPRERYYDAAMRHLMAWREGEKNDPESGMHHLAHAGCCVLFILWFELKGK